MYIHLGYMSLVLFIISSICTSTCIYGVPTMVVDGYATLTYCMYVCFIDCSP